MRSFLVDRNVGRLVTWLRAFGFDTEFADDGGDGELVRRALQEGRAVVTKDRKLLDRRVITSGQLSAVYIRSDRLTDQLREFLAAVPVGGDELFSRCVRCNVLLRAVQKEEVREEVPPYVYQHHDAFRRCPGCGRIYWQGTHWEHMSSVLRKAVGHAGT